jgi:gliding motility-associated-like protein
VSTSFAVTVTPNVTPTFSFGTSMTTCAGSAVPTLSTTSSNGISGSWSPSTVSNQNSATYTFTPAAGQCAVPVTFNVTITPNTVPVFSFGTTLTICDGGTVPVLPTTSTNGVNGSWSPAVVNNHTSGVYTFTPVVAPGQCIITTTFTVTVKPVLTPTFSFGNTLTLCSGSTAPVLATTSTNGVTGTWNPAVINNQAGGTYTFTTGAGQCAAPSATLTVAINPTPVVNLESDTTVTDGTFVPAHVFKGAPAGLSFNWTNSNTSIGLGASGTGNVPSFTAINKGSAPAIGVVSVTPALNGCTGVSQSYKITVLPLEKDVFVPNVFTPNGDGKNEILFVYGNYISKLDMRIFNQWGELVFRTDSKSKGWDGTRNGTAQPVGVYLYALEAVLTDGRTVKLNGNINLLR